MVKARWTLVLLAAALSVPTTAIATHMSSYVFYPTEHDDFGRSYEPDFLSTGVLGANIGNCIVSTSLSNVCTPDTALPGGNNGAQLAPGCTDDQGRQPSGLCGLFTIGAGNGNTGTVVPAGTLGTAGTSGNGAPGRFTPTKGTSIRFLDARLGFQNVPPAGGTTYVDYNSKLGDNGVQGLLSGLDGSLGGDAILPGGSGLWAWYGTWTDKNGNGVVDHLRSAQECSATACPPSGGVADNNEFVWRGTCTQFNGQSAPPGQKYCDYQASALLPVWVWPGNHHAFCGLAAVGPECGASPTDYPGRVFVAYAIGTSCPSTTCIQELEDFDGYFGGDPVFGEQYSRKVDTNGAGNFGTIWGMSDRTGEPLINGRQWVFGNGFATWFWDQSLIVTTQVIAAVTTSPAVEGLETDFELGDLLYKDVDRYSTWNPVAEDLVQNTLKGTTRGAWLTVRPIIAAEDAVGQLEETSPAGTRLTYDECDPYLAVCPATGTLRSLAATQNRVFGSGNPKEPNAAGDLFPGATRGSCADAYDTFQGLCNTYAGYAAAPRGWLEVFDNNAIYTNLAWRTPIGSCVLCVTNGPSGTTDVPDILRAANDFAPVLDPGSHVFSGLVGAWQDRAQPHEERALDLVATLTSLSPQFREANYVVPADGWIGDVVNTTGASRISGFLPELCTVGGVTAVREYAVCHPYMEGNRGNSHNYGTDPSFEAREFTLAEEGGGSGVNGQWQLRISATDGCWDIPVFVWRAFDTWTIGDTTQIEDFSNTCNTIVFDLGRGPGFASKDLLILPQGNLGESVTTSLAGTATVTRDGAPIVSELVRDVDVYAPWGTISP